MAIRIFLFIFIGLSFFPHVLKAQENDAFRSTDYPLPRFVSLASDKVYVRAGPGSRFPIKWEFQKKGLPVEVILEFDTWRKIRDFDAQEGWVHQSLLSGRRAAIIKSQEMVAVRRKPNETGRLVAKMEPGVVAEIDKCQESWCRLEASGYKGWVQRGFVWGVYEGEAVE